MEDFFLPKIYKYSPIFYVIFLSFYRQFFYSRYAIPYDTGVIQLFQAELFFQFFCQIGNQSLAERVKVCLILVWISSETIVCIFSQTEKKITLIS